MDEDIGHLDHSGEIDTPEEFFLERGDMLFRSLPDLIRLGHAWQQGPLGSVFIAQLIRECEVDRAKDNF